MWIVEHQVLLMGLTLLFGLLMAGAVGANDVANAMGTSVGARILTIRQAVIVAGVFEALGALLASGQVSQTLSKGVIDVQMFASTPELLVLGMIAALMAAGLWLIIATCFAWPVSTTHAIVGALIGFGAIGAGLDKVNWLMVGNIACSWVITPAISGVVAYLLFVWVQKTVLASRSPHAAAIKHIPIHMFLVSLVVTWVTLALGLKPLGLHISTQQVWCFSLIISVILAYLGRCWLQRMVDRLAFDHAEPYALVERAFGVLAVFTACAMAFAHGSNDTANAIGPMAAVFDLLASGGKVTFSQPLPFWLVIVGACGVVLGLAVYGYRVIATVGTNITELTPSRGFAAQLSTATTVVVCSGLGLPVSTTQILIGAVLGVGLARGLAAINLHVVRDILVSWVITLPAGATLAILCYKILIFVLLGH